MLLPKLYQIDSPNLLQYTVPNPITPTFLYFCMKRIFSRKNHSCLSSEDKPKVVEVLLKFTRLYDNINFQDEKALSQYFDKTAHVDFISYSGKNGGITDETFNTLVQGVNKTPTKFIAPSDEVI